MQNLEQGYAATFDFPPAEMPDAVAVLPSEERIAMVNGGAEAPVMPPETRELIKKELRRQLQLLEPLYKVTHVLRENVSHLLLEGVKAHEPMGFGFDELPKESLNIDDFIERLQDSAEFLLGYYEKMQGPASDVIMAGRQVALRLETELLGFVIRFKEYAGEGELDRSNHPAFFDDLRELQHLLGAHEQALEGMRGRIG